MEIKVLYFGVLQEITNCKQEIFEFENNLNNLLVSIKKKYPLLAFHTFTIAVNNKLVNPDTILNNQDEVALLPPFSGG